ncbi:MAG TPA: HNH endonuclease signature motif containing protein, partial [Jatrophihabitantaceae bacterium]
PNCNRQACHCELDHATGWENGGTTSESNIECLCSRHHHGKHDAGWAPKRLEHGSTEWTGPTGHRYVEPPATYPVDHTTGPPDKTEPDAAEETNPDPPPF